MKKTTFLPTLLGVLVVASAVPASAKMPWVKKAAAVDASIKDCTACHASKAPKKGEALSERGKFLMEQKAKHKAEEIDFAWLKDYKGK